MNRCQIKVLSVTVFIFLCVGKVYAKKVLRYGEIGKPISVDPITISDAVSDRISSLIFNSLIDFDDDLEVIPVLAEKWDIDFGIGKTIITFHLRKGVKWHDGREFTAKDVIHTFLTIMDERTLSHMRNKYKDVVIEASAIDDYKVRFILKGTNVANLGLMDFRIVPDHLFKDTFISRDSEFGRRPVGTGPYKLSEWRTDKIVLTANDVYFFGRPRIDQAIPRFFGDRFVMLAEFETKGIDLMLDISTDVIDRVRGDPSNSVISFPDMSYSFIAINLRKPFLNDRRVRQAMALAFDVKKAKDVILRGEGTVISGPFPVISWAYNPAVRPWPYSPDLAKQMLQEAGFNEGEDGILVSEDGRRFSVTLKYTMGNEIDSKVAIVFKEYMSKVGIDVILKPVEWSRLIRDVVDLQDFDLVILKWNMGVDPDIYDIFHSSQSKKGFLNFVGYSNNEVDKLIEESREEKSYSKRKDIYYKLHRIIREDVPYIFLWSHNRNIGAKRYLTNLSINPINIFQTVNQWDIK